MAVLFPSAPYDLIMQPCLGGLVAAPHSPWWMADPMAIATPFGPLCVGLQGLYTPPPPLRKFL